MATVFDEVNIKGLRITHFNQLLSYMNSRDEEGCYYGDKKQFEQRHKDLQKWIKGIIDYASSEGVVIPKK